MQISREAPVRSNQHQARNSYALLLGLKLVLLEEAV